MLLLPLSYASLCSVAKIMSRLFSYIGTLCAKYRGWASVRNARAPRERPRRRNKMTRFQNEDETPSGGLKKRNRTRRRCVRKAAREKRKGGQGSFIPEGTWPPVVLRVCSQSTCVKRGAESEKRCKDYRAFAAGPLVAWTTALSGARKTVVEVLIGGEFRR